MSNPSPRRPTEGSRALWRAVQRHHEGKPARLAAALGFDDGIVYRWISGERRPGLDAALKLRNSAGIPVELWSEQLPGWSPDDEATPAVAPSPEAA